ncbi:MAG: HIT family protein [Johnsonella sp.]|nr:HIT family protein [Johnsonella sp.]
MRDDHCIFCKIANGDIPSSTVFEDEEFRAILDISPATKGHTLILPKEHFKDISELPKDLSSKIPALASRIGEAAKRSLGASGYNILMNTGESAGQTVFHCHIHIIPRYENGEKIVAWEPKNMGEQEGALEAMRDAL